MSDIQYEVPELNPEESKLMNFFWKWHLEKNNPIIQHMNFIENEVIKEEKKNVNFLWKRRYGRTWTSIYIAFRLAMKRKCNISLVRTASMRQLFGTLKTAQLFIKECNLNAEIDQCIINDSEENAIKQINKVLSNYGMSMDKLKENDSDLYIRIENYVKLTIDINWRSTNVDINRYGEYRIRFKNGSVIYIPMKLRIDVYLPSIISCTIIDDEIFIKEKGHHPNKITFNTDYNHHEIM